MTLNESLKNFHEKWSRVTKALTENVSLYDCLLAILLVSMSLLLLSIAYTVLLNGGLEYSVRIGGK